MYGKTKNVNNLETNHIRKVMFECKQNETEYFNIAGTELKPKIDETQLQELNVIHQDIQKFHIISKSRHTKKNKSNKTYMLNDKNVAESVGNKVRVKKSKFQDVIDIKNKYIADVCFISTKEVEKQRKEILQKSPNPQQDGSYI